MVGSVFIRILQAFSAPIRTRAYLYIYILGLASSIFTVPDAKGAKMYEAAPWELMLDVYVVSALLLLVPRSVIIGRWKVCCRFIAKVLLYVGTYSLYIIDTFCFVKFGSCINPSMLMLMGETNGDEASEFLSSYVGIDLLGTEVGIVIAIALVHALNALLWRRYGKGFSAWCSRFFGQKVKVSFTVILAFAVSYLLYCSYEESVSNKEMFLKVMSYDTVGDVEREMASQPHTTLYQPIYRLVFAIYCNSLAEKQLERLKKQVGHVEIDSVSYRSSNIILIINESVNKRRAQLYGYEKPNMPHQMRLFRQGKLHRFDDVISPWNLTSYVFKDLMTTYCVGDSGDWCDYPLFCEVFRKAGFKVSFFTNQFLSKPQEAVYDFSGGFFINDPTLSKAQFDVRNAKLHVFDDGLIADYEQSSVPQMMEQRQPNLTIFHLMGMHVSYRVRCPNSQKKWTFEDYEAEQDLPKKRRKILSEYDNAVLYNDSIINQIIERVNEKDAIVVLISDHGEEVFGPGARHFFGRMHKTAVDRRLADEEFRVPMWIYCTPKYALSHPDVVAAIKQSHSKPYMTDALSHLLFGLAGISSQYYRPDKDILSPDYNAARKRLIKGNIDYEALQ